MREKEEIFSIFATKNILVMSPYNPDIHHRQSIRLKGYDYASKGLYFVTICTQNRDCLFGVIENDVMLLNDAGRMVERWYWETQNKFPDIVCHEMVIMPNHFHCIWENVGSDLRVAVGAHLRVRPSIINVRPSIINVRPSIFNVRPSTTKNVYPSTNDDEMRDTNNDAHGFDGGAHGFDGGAQNNMGTDICGDGDVKGAHIGAPLRVENDILDDSNCVENTGSPLSAVVRWFKTMSTNEYIRGVKQLGWPPFDRKLWQRNYFEHIVRDDTSLRAIAHYIASNPTHWPNDKFFQSQKTIR